MEKSCEDCKVQCGTWDRLKNDLATRDKFRGKPSNQIGRELFKICDKKEV